MVDENVPTFQGRVIHPLKALAAAHGLKHAREVWFPISQDDVATAIARPRIQKMFVRSGTQATAVTDMVDAAGGTVLNLAELKNIHIDNGVLKAEVAATIEEVGKKLAKDMFALPLGENRYQSIASNVIFDEPSCLMRTLGRLPDYITSLNVVTPDGQAMTLTGASALSESRDLKAVITEFDFKPASAKNLWMVRTTFPYPGKAQFSAIAKVLFLNAKIPEKSDLVLDAFTGRHGIALVQVTALGSVKEDELTLGQLVKAALASLPSSFDQITKVKPFHGSDVIKTIANTGFGIPLDPQIDTHRIPRIVEQNDNVNEILDLVTGYVDRGLGAKDDRTGAIDIDLSLFLRLQLNRDDRLELSGLAYMRKDASSSFPTRLASLTSVPSTPTPHSLTLEATPEVSVVTSATVVVEASATVLAEASATVVTEVSATVVTEISATAFGLFPVSEPPIPGFKGEVYRPSDWLFRTYANQYATSSFPVEDMTPFMVAYPKDVDDIKAALKFARAKNKHIAARSGGHQYCGKSSGGNSTIVLAMDAFNRFQKVTENIVELGPAVRLTDFAADFKSLGITIPHGECPLVNIGGHGQTGGFGHLLRGFGLAIDYIVSFTIVLADGTVRTVNRPEGTPTTENDELFWGVLGGNAGSFGIVIQFQIECVIDQQHPHSYGYAATRIYGKERYTNLMKQVQIWTQEVKAGTKPAGIDFTVTVESNAGLNPFPLLLVEMVHSNLGGLGETVKGEEVFKSIIQASDEDSFGLLTTTKGTKPLSFWSDFFVRRFPSTTVDGREFKYPYKKRVNCTTIAMTNAFLKKFVDMVDKVVNTDGVYLVFQMMIGGGAFQTSPRREQTSIPRRDFVFCFVFDVFYADGFMEVAEQLQEEMQGIVNTEFSPGQEQRLFWGSFGETDMRETSVQKFYYDDIGKYVRLQQLKKKVDPNDVFHTSLTVQLP